MLVSISFTVVHCIYYILLTASLTIFVHNPWSRLCCICLFKFVIITLHYIYFRLSKWRPSIILDLVWRHSRPPMICVWWF